MVEAAELADDGRQGRRDDHVVELRQQHGEDQPAHGGDDLAWSELLLPGNDHLEFISPEWLANATIWIRSLTPATGGPER